ncbi:MAG: acyloxyacyl hydrolase [Verrucomicrobiota bacterium]|nr:acyloxyacyl hydrolase [Verrucomicrobiota bacterium]
MFQKRSFLTALIITPSLFLATPPLPLPDWISFVGGIFDVTKEKHRTIEIDLEYKFHIKAMSGPFEFLEFLPLVGIMANAEGGGYVYGGINFDFLFWDHLVIAPGFAAGGYWAGSGKNLGFPLEFRSGIELGWQFDDGRRIGTHFYHLSNASLGKKNPGEESLVFYYDLPIRKKFPFYN